MVAVREQKPGCTCSTSANPSAKAGCPLQRKVSRDESLVTMCKEGLRITDSCGLATVYTLRIPQPRSFSGSILCFRRYTPPVTHNDLLPIAVAKQHVGDPGVSDIPVKGAKPKGLNWDPKEQRLLPVPIRFPFPSPTITLFLSFSVSKILRARHPCQGR